MKKVMFFTLMVVAGLCFRAYAADVAASDKPVVVAAAGTVQLVEVPNKICPVSHEEVGKNGMAPHKVTYNGKVYNLCCNMCDKDFNKDPAKYAKIMEDEVAATQAAAAKKI